MTETTTGAGPRTDVITTEVRGDVFLIGLNRPEKRNALNGEMFEAISAAYAQYDRDDNLRCAVLYGQGAVYCAGADLTQLNALVNDGDLVYRDGEYDPFGLEGSRLSKPLIAAVHGMCFAGGMELALAGEFIVAAEGTLFGQPEVARGLFAFGGGAARWPAVVGYANAQRYLLTGDLLDAKEALRIGLVQELVAPEKLFDRALEIATAVAAASPIGVRNSLAVSRIAVADGLPAAIDEIRPLRTAIVSTHDAAEGVVSFQERRAGKYIGR